MITWAVLGQPTKVHCIVPALSGLLISFFNILGWGSREREGSPRAHKGGRPNKSFTTEGGDGRSLPGYSHLHLKHLGFYSSICMFLCIF